MNGVGKAFADDAPLESEFAIIIKSGAFIGTPTHGAVVNDNILVVFDAVHSVVSFCLMSTPMRERIKRTITLSA